MFLKSFSNCNVKQVCYGSSHAIPQEGGRASFPMKTGKFMLTFDLSREAQLHCKRTVSVTGMCDCVYPTSIPTTAPLEVWIMTTIPSTYSITMQRCRLVSKEQNMLTTKGFSANVRISLSTKACWIWFLRIRFCLLIFFMAKRWRVVLCRTKYTALQKHTPGGKGPFSVQTGLLWFKFGALCGFAVLLGVF